MNALEMLPANIMIGLETAFSLSNLFYCFIGVFLGTLIGVIPGIGALAAISMLFPLTLYLDPTAALVMLAGIYYGTSYGGSTASILLNVPGTPSGAVATLDGYPMTKQGRGGIALSTTTIASFIGGSIGIILMMLLSPLIVEFALRFGSPEYFSLMLLGLIAASSISTGSMLTGIAMVAFGICLGLVGTDISSGVQRFTFGAFGLLDGVSLVALAMGLFGVTEVISAIRSSQKQAKEGERVAKVTLRSMIPTRDDVRRSWMPMFRGTALGSFFGTLPGTGAIIASFMAYAVEKKVSKTPEEFGQGAIEGVVAPEAANNAADQTAFIPTLTLGIPGSASMAIMLGVLMIHGIAPGPMLLSSHPDIFWGLVMSFWIGNVMLVVLNLPLIGIWVRLVAVPFSVLYPAIVMFVAIGVYSVNNSIFDVWMVIAIGALGYLMRVLNLPPAPLLLGYVLGPLMEEHFRRAMMFSRGDFMTFVNRPISGTILALTVLILVYGAWSGIKGKKNRIAPV
ncbi:tripartite tricarboxylate transporter permease [Devosia sp. YIM 151766]|uniref:tripartite tricarboxylate transporter permease n=1 Tax=Devosia sp. YIM 151766 TaxID=3017325 RepID=UPI00255C7FE6|nr:tripartite tricarboxylate transporter permease [Devosia sp. YIM 151766]WIY52383.1 tripartite tricarboxylate transporter permease [Devosia sp. YIM 151766]